MKVIFFITIFVVIFQISILPGLAVDFYWEVITTFNNVTDIQIQNDTLYAATTGGFLIYDINDQQHIAFNAEDGLSDNNFTTLTLSNKDIVILGTQSGVLTFFNKKKNTFTEDFRLQGNEIRSLFVVDDTLWVVSSTLVAVYLFEPEKQVFQFRDFYNNFNRTFKKFQQVVYFDHKNPPIPGNISPPQMAYLPIPFFL